MILFMCASAAAVHTAPGQRFPAPAMSFEFGDGSSGGTTVAPQVVIEQLERQGVDERLSAADVGLLGDLIDPDTGSLVFAHTDVSLPGNSGLEVAIRRRREQGLTYYPTVAVDFGDWQLDVPRMSMLLGQHTTNGAASGPAPVWPLGGSNCTGPSVPGPMMLNINQGYGIPAGAWNWDQYTQIDGHAYSNGMQVHVPGSGSQLVIGVPQGAQWPAGTARVTLGNWRFECLSNGYVGIAPNGDRYRFDRLIYREAPWITVGPTYLARTLAILVATEVTDVNGNWVRYSYDSSDRLTRIEANDGRLITLGYAAGSQLIDTVTANGRVWSYSYQHYPDGMLLTNVTLPDGRAWSFDLGRMFRKPSPGASCSLPDGTVSITHPNGIVGDFVLRETRFGRKNIPHAVRSTVGYCSYENPESQHSYFEADSVISKTLAGPGYPPATWAYSYENGTGTFGDSAAVPDTRWSQVIDPLGHRTIYRHHRRVDHLDGLLIREERYETASATTPVQTTDYTYVVENSVGETYMLSENDSKLTRPRHADRVTVTRGVDQYVTDSDYNTDQSDIDYSWGAPTRVVRSNSYTTIQRTEDVTYLHDETLWRLALPLTVARNGKLFARYHYDSLGRVTRQDAFGHLLQRIGYHTADGQQGAVAWAEDALGRRIWFDNYHRGRPELITRADGSMLERDVDPNGWVTRETDANLNTTNYAYNDVGWLTLIDRPAPWSDTSISYTANGSGVTQMLTRGPSRTTVEYDGLQRVFLEWTEALSGGGDTVWRRTEFDALGHVVFSSFPSDDVLALDGTSFTFDALGRPLTEAENVAPFATTSYAYLSQNRSQVTDPVGNATTYHYDAFGQPDGGELVQIAQPMGVNTYLDRNAYGQTMEVRQAGSHNGYTLDQSQYFSYDDRLRMCRYVTAEGGHTYYAYNDAGEMTAYAKGAAPSANCLAPSGSTRVDLTYDQLGRLTVTDFVDAGTPDITRSYDANGNVLSVLRGGIDWTYQYDNANHLTSERLDVDGLSFPFSYTYDQEGNRLTRSLPGGFVETRQYNGLGQTVSVSGGGQTFATGMTYHESGQLEAASYGNGTVRTTTFTARQRPLQMRVASGSVAALDQTFAYDANGRITSLTDLADVGNDRSYGYDALGRLTSASGPWGAGSYVYDPLANLRSKTLGSRTVSIAFDDTTNRAVSSNDSVNGFRNIGYDERGNVTTLGAFGFVYDMADQPVVQSGAVTGSYAYDGSLKRVRQELDGEVRYSVYDATGSLVLRQLVRDAPAADLDTHFLAVGGVQVRVESGVASYAVQDHLGTPVAGVSGGGSIDWRERLSPYGEALLPAAENADSPSFTGHVHDARTGLTYMQARFFDPALGRFLSIDPVGFNIGQPSMFNRYAYGSNAPSHFVDPDGRCSRDIAQSALLCGVQDAIISAIEPILEQAMIGAGVEVLPPSERDPEGVYGQSADEQPVQAEVLAIAALVANAVVEKVEPGRRGREFTRAQRRAAIAENRSQNDGQLTCTDCGRNDLQEGVASRRGEPTPPNQAQAHHDPPIHEGGGRESDLIIVCPECHRDRHRNER